MRVNPQSVPNQNVETAEKSLPETLQKRQLPSYVYQLFEKKEVLEVFISYVSHRFSCLVFCSLSTRPTFLFLLLTVLMWLNTVFKCQFLIHIFFYLCLGTHFFARVKVNHRRVKSHILAEVCAVAMAVGLVKNKAQKMVLFI